jgi:basic membrane protein A
MHTKSLWRLMGLMVVVAMLLVACQQEPAVEEVGGFQIPAIEEGKTNVAMVLIGPHDDGGWSQAHYEGLEYVAENVDNVHVAYIENVPQSITQRFRLDLRYFVWLYGPDGNSCKRVSRHSIYPH